MKPSFADILQGLDGERARKVARKLPSWAAAGAEIPSALALEQCSSEAAARYKAALAARIVSTPLNGQLPLETSGCAGPLPSDDGPLPLTMPRVARFPEAAADSTSRAVAGEDQVVVFWPQNWRKGGLQERRGEIVREQGFYNQNWCGCEFSKPQTL